MRPMGLLVLTVVLVTACLIGDARGDKHKNRKYRMSKRKMNTASIIEDVHVLQQNISELWETIHHIQHDHSTMGQGGVANVSVSVTGVDGEEVASTRDSTGTHVHVHLHMDSMPYGQKEWSHRMEAIHGHQGMYLKEKGMQGSDMMHEKGMKGMNTKHAKNMKGMKMMQGKDMKGMKMMQGKKDMKGMKMMQGKKDMKGMKMMQGKEMKGMHVMHGKSMKGMHMMHGKGMKGMHMMHGHGAGKHAPSKEYMKKHHWHHPDPDQYMYARCNVSPDPNLSDDEKNLITGVVQLRQKIHEDIEVRVHLEGFDPETTIHHHGFHVHQYGDESEGCKSLGGHFNPDDTLHGGPSDAVRHVGDWGNVHCDKKGEVHKNFTDSHAQLIGPHSILGRGIVIHHHMDDLGKGDSPASKMSGDAGPRLACCVIVWSADQDWSTPFHPNHNAP